MATSLSGPAFYVYNINAYCYPIFFIYLKSHKSIFLYSISCQSIPLKCHTMGPLSQEQSQMQCVMEKKDKLGAEMLSKRGNFKENVSCKTVYCGVMLC